MANAPILVVLDLDETMVSLLRKHNMSKSMINDMGHGSLLDFGKQKFDLDIITTCYNNEEMHYAIRPNVDLFVKFLKAHEHIIDVVVFSAAVQEICDDLVNMIELPVKACYGRRNSKSPVIPKDISHLPGASSYDYIVVFDDQPQNFPYPTTNTYKASVTKYHWCHYDDGNVSSWLSYLQGFVDKIM